MKLPTMFNVINKQIDGEYTKLELQRCTDMSDIFWWQILSSKRGELVRHTFINPLLQQQEDHFYEYSGYYLTPEGYVSKPMSFCHLNANTIIDFRDIQSIPDKLQIIYECENV